MSRSEVHSEVRETHPRVGCGTRRRGNRSQRSEGSSPTCRGRASTAARSQCAPRTSSEVQRLQALVAQLQSQLVQVAGPTPVTVDIPRSKRARLREDFVPSCVEEMQQRCGIVNKTPGGNHGRQVGGGGKDLPIDCPKCSRRRDRLGQSRFGHPDLTNFGQ